MSQFYKLDVMKVFWFFSVLGALILLCSDTAFATDISGTDLPYEESLDKLKQSITGPVANFIAVIAAAGGIITWMVTPDLSGVMRLLIILAIGIGALIGVVNLVEAFSGESALIVANAQQSLHYVGKNYVGA